LHTNYFPRFTPAGLKKGLLWKIWDIQGQRKTTWIGSSVSFESVLDVVVYNNNLIQYVNVAAESTTNETLKRSPLLPQSMWIQNSLLNSQCALE
ncbi:hypothetical protein DYB34_010651, partial [Aphanomyces astaci]